MYAPGNVPDSMYVMFMNSMRRALALVTNPVYDDPDRLRSDTERRIPHCQLCGKSIAKHISCDLAYGANVTVSEFGYVRGAFRLDKAASRQPADRATLQLWNRILATARRLNVKRRPSIFSLAPKKMGDHMGDHITRETGIVFRGKETLEDTMHRYDDCIKKVNTYVEAQCKHQIEAMQKAQTDLESKMEEVMKQQEFKNMETKTQQENQAVSKQMRTMQRELHRMEDEIYDKTTDLKDRDAKLHALHKAAISHYSDLSKKYPAVMRAQMLSNMRLLH